MICYSKKDITECSYVSRSFSNEENCFKEAEKYMSLHCFSWDKNLQYRKLNVSYNQI